MSEISQNIVQIKNKNITLTQLNQELDKYLYNLSVLFRDTNELQKKVQGALDAQK